MTLRAKLIAIAYRIKGQHDVAADLLNLAEQVGEAEAKADRVTPVAIRRTPDEDELKDSMLCAHANEMPQVCPCEGPCYCKRSGGPCDTTW